MHLISTFIENLRMIDRLLRERIRPDFSKKQVILIKGPRNCGKSVLLRAIFSESDPTLLWIDGDRLDHRNYYTDINGIKDQGFTDQKEVIIIEQVQRFEDPVSTIRRFLERYPSTHLIITSSVSIDVFNGSNETDDFTYGELLLFPLSYQELINELGKSAEDGLFESRLRYGTYPLVIEEKSGSQQEVLNSLIDDFLCKDLFADDRIKKNALLSRLLTLLAERIGEVISFNDLAKKTGVDKETIERYIDALEQAFVIFQLNSFSENSKLELKKSRKIYFYDNGIRNAILSDFSPIHERKDAKMLIENYLISERIKYNYARKYFPRMGFWKTTQQLEVTYLEQSGKELEAFIFHDVNNQISRSLKTFSRSYPEVKVTQIVPIEESHFISEALYSYENENKYYNMRTNTNNNNIDDSEWEVD